MENNLVLVLVNNTKEEWLYYELFKIGESHTVTGVLELISRMAWTTNDDIQIIKDKYMTHKQKNGLLCYTINKLIKILSKCKDDILS